MFIGRINRLDFHFEGDLTIEQAEERLAKVMDQANRFDMTMTIYPESLEIQEDKE
jgi:hypothetical protein